jgi:hypothetical protein
MEVLRLYAVQGVFLGGAAPALAALAIRTTAPRRESQ